MWEAILAAVAQAVAAKAVDSAMPKHDIAQPQPIPTTPGMDINSLVGPQETQSKLPKLQLRQPFQGDY